MGGKQVKEGDSISIDGSTGEVILGKMNTSPSEVLQVLVDGTLERGRSRTFSYFEKVMGWADEARRLKVRANADTPADAAAARALGAEGIGLCRSEHMFFDADRIGTIRKIILARDGQDRAPALEGLLRMQRSDFAGIFRAMDGLPVTIRLMDPPMHEFLPHDAGTIQTLAAEMKTDPDEVRRRIEGLREANPMLGHRGCRLGITHPEIYETQVRAIF